ncbi:MAG: hypothetical protein ABWY38_03280 [Methyloceanibacter sp.]
MPSGYDAEVAELFRDLRAASNLSETALAQRLGTRIEVVQALEQGALYALPPWPETCRIVNGYGALLNLDIRPLLRRIYAQLEAGIVQLGPRTMPEMPVLHPPEDADFEVDRPTTAPSGKNSQWPGASQQPGQNAWPQQAQQPQTAPWPPPAMPQQPPPQQAPWPGYAPQPHPQQPAWPNGGQQGMPQQSWPSAPQPQQQPQPQARPDGQAQQRPAQAYAPQPQAQSQPQPQTPQPQQRKAPQEQPQPVAPAAKTKRLKPERAARSSTWLLKWGLGALVVSVVAFGLWIAFGDPSGTLGGKSLSPSGSGQVLDPDDPRSRKADKLPSAF